MDEEKEKPKQKPKRTYRGRQVIIRLYDSENDIVEAKAASAGLQYLSLLKGL